MSGKGKIVDNKDIKNVKADNKVNKGKIIEHNTNTCPPEYPNKNENGECCLLPENNIFYTKILCKKME